MHCFLQSAQMNIKFSWYILCVCFVMDQYFSKRSFFLRIKNSLWEVARVWRCLASICKPSDQSWTSCPWKKILKNCLAYAVLRSTAVLDIELGQIFVRRMIFWRRGCVILRRSQSRSWMIFFFSRPLSDQSLKKAMSISFFVAHSKIYSSQTAITAKN